MPLYCEKLIQTYLKPEGKAGFSVKKHIVLTWEWRPPCPFIQNWLLLWRDRGPSWSGHVDRSARPVVQTIPCMGRRGINTWQENWGILPRPYPESFQWYKVFREGLMLCSIYNILDVLLSSLVLYPEACLYSVLECRRFIASACKLLPMLCPWVAIRVVPEIATNYKNIES